MQPSSSAERPGTGTKNETSRSRVIPLGILTLFVIGATSILVGRILDVIFDARDSRVLTENAEVLDNALAYIARDIEGSRLLPVATITDSLPESAVGLYPAIVFQDREARIHAYFLDLHIADEAGARGSAAIKRFTLTNGEITAEGENLVDWLDIPRQDFPLSCPEGYLPLNDTPEGSSFVACKGSGKVWMALRGNPEGDSGFTYEPEEHNLPVREREVEIAR